MQGLPQSAGAHALITVSYSALIRARGFIGPEMDIGAENDWHFEQTSAESGVIVVAWGKSKPCTSRKLVIDPMLEKQEDKLVLAGKSHPSRVSYHGYVLPNEA